MKVYLNPETISRCSDGHGWFSVSLPPEGNTAIAATVLKVEIRGALVGWWMHIIIPFGSNEYPPAWMPVESAGLVRDEILY